MDNTTEVQLSTQLKEKLETLAGDYNTNIDSVIKLVLVENQNLKHPEGYLTDSKVSKSRNGKSKSYTYSTVIPKPIVNKFRLDKGRKLYWDIDEYKIVITPELVPTPTPEEVSIEAGNQIFNEMLVSGYTDFYISTLNKIKSVLGEETTTDKKVKALLDYYNNTVGNKRYGGLTREKEDFKKLLLYLLDYPLGVQDQYEILKEVYDKITQE